MADSDREAEVEALAAANAFFAETCARHVAAGLAPEVARDRAQAVATQFYEGFLEGYQESRVEERARLAALHQSFAVHGPDAQRWLLALELGSSTEDAALQPPFTLSH